MNAYPLFAALHLITGTVALVTFWTAAALRKGSPLHRRVGQEVGPDLLSALRTKTRDSLLLDILDPSRDVDPRYINYVVSTKDGKVLTGMIAVEAPTSITLRRAEKAEDTILRTQLDEVQATAKSLMPEELEKQLSKQDVADVIAYLLATAGAGK